MATGDGSPGITRPSTETLDATVRRRAEEALPGSETILQRLLESASEAVIIVDGDSRIVLFSARAEEMFGYSRDELIGQPVETLIPGQFRDAHIRHRAGYVAHPRVRPMSPDPNLVGRRKDGTEFPVEIDLTFIEKGGAGLVMSLITDITERKRAERALRASREELEGRVERQLLRRNPYGLTFRELTVLHLVAAGRSGKEIGIDLGISPLTARKHISNILAKMDVASRTEAVAQGLREGLLE